MKKFFALVLTMVMLVSMTACGGKQSDSPTTGEQQANASGDGTYEWSLAVVTAENHPMTKACMTFADKVREASDGRIDITVYYAGQLGSDPETCAQVMDGTIEMAFPSVGNMVSFTELVYAYQLPFMITNWDQYLELSKSQEAADLKDAIGEQLGCKVLASWNSGFRHLLAVDKPITQVSDCKGKKFRVGENDLFVSLFSALGASPTVIAYGEIYTALQNKVIDALEMDISAVWMEKHYEVAKNLTLTGHFTWPGLCLINDAAWASLSADDQALFEKAAVETLDENIAYIAQTEEETTQKLEDAGVTIVEMTDAMYQDFNKAEEPVIEKFTGNDLVRAYYEKAIALQ